MLTVVMTNGHFIYTKDGKSMKMHIDNFLN